MNSPTTDVAPRAAGYNIPYDIVDGQDIETTFEAAKKAVDHARSGRGPYLVEFKSFRMATHYSGDPGDYVNPEDLEAWAKKDPIDLCQQKILDRNIMTPEQDNGLREEIETRANEAAAAALEAADPVMADLFEGIFSEKGVF